MVSEGLYLALLAAIAGQRLFELRLSRRNARWAFARGGVELGRGHFRPMVLLHALFLAGCGVEVLALDRPYTPVVGIPMLILVVVAQGLRISTQIALGRFWNTRVIVIPGMPRVRSGPYRYLRHPNYLAVVVEGFALPLVHGAWVTALVFTLADAWLLRTRIRCENEALSRYAGGAPRVAALAPEAA